MKKLPKEIYVHIEGDKAGEWLEASESTTGIADNTKVGVYRLVEVKTQRVTEELV